MKRATLLFILVGIGGCGGSHPPYPAATDEPQSDLQGYEARLEALQRELDRAAPARASGEPLANEPVRSPESCQIAADLRDRICDLSQRICDIAQRDPSAADTALKCQNATAACTDARERVSRACGGER